MQVVAAADKLRDPSSGTVLVRTAYVNPRDGPPLEPPDIIVSTPAGLIGTVDTWSESAGWEWTSTGLANRYGSSLSFPQQPCIEFSLCSRQIRVYM